jgi:drug/metabolite transporter (DMT)-like permease
MNFKYLLISILFVCLSSFFFAIHDSILKFISSSQIKWYHHMTIGAPFGLLLIITIMYFTEGLNNIFLKSYKIPLIRGILAIPSPLMAFISLKYISLSIFTTLILTLPFFLVIFANIFLKEKITKNIFISLILGFVGVILIIRPGFINLNIFIFFPIIMSAIMGFNMILLNKFKHIATSNTYALYNLLIPFTFGLIFFLNDPFFPEIKYIFIIILTWINGILGLLFITYAYHRAKSNSNKIAPYIYTQLIWAVLFGSIFYNDHFNMYNIAGSFLIVVCGIIVLIKQK